MKKLMFAALAVASCSAFAAKNVQVNDLTLTKKSLAYATKSYSIKFEAASWEAAEKQVKEQFEKDLKAITNACVYDIEIPYDTFDTAWKLVKKGDKVKGTFKYTAPAVDNKGVAKTKVVTKKLNGFVIDRAADGCKTYLWDGTKNEWGKIWGYEIPDAKFGKGVGTADGKAHLAMSIVNDEHNLQAVATGTCDKKDPKVLKSVAGNFADCECMGYGTWKLAANKSVTKKAIDEASGVNSDEDILALKKVELVK